MLTSNALAIADPFVDAVRRREFSRLDRDRVAYLDYTGAALYADCQLRSHRALLTNGVFGNPHSESDPSRASTAQIDAARALVLRFLDADPDQYTVCFTANASAAIKLVAEAYPFARDSALVLSADNHNSVNGIREYAHRAGSDIGYLSLDDELRLSGARNALADYARRSRGRKLFAFPAQSNFSGVQHPLDLIADAHQLGYEVMLDAAAFAPSNRLSLRDHSPDFVALSFYKIFGYPTGVGALVARSDALARLARPWFAGGTVEYASVQNDLHQLKPRAEGFEDGTPDFLNIAALAAGFAFLDEVGIDRVHAHVARLTELFLSGLAERSHHGAPTARVYGPTGLTARGGTIAFNVLSHQGRVIAHELVEKRARDAGIAFRGGCFCNPGAAERAFGFDAPRTRECLRDLSDRDGAFTIDRLSACLGRDTAVGAVRASFGLATTADDVARALTLVGSFAD